MSIYCSEIEVVFVYAVSCDKPNIKMQRSGLTMSDELPRLPPAADLGVTTSENVSLAADMVKQAIKTGQSVL
jgi:hypothetical protein